MWGLYIEKNMDVIEENNHKSKYFRDSSFVGRLHEEGFVDLNEYLRLEDAIYALSESYGENIPRNKVVRFGIISTLLLKMLVYHKNPSDGYQFSNASESQVIQLLDRMNIVLEGLSSSIMPDKTHCQN